jgi:Putative ATPase subunit of terminase (gpP-like)
VSTRPAVADSKAITPHPKEVRERAFEMFKAGAPFSDIAADLRIAAPTLRSWSRREKWTEQRKLAQVNPTLDREQLASLAQREDDLEIPEGLSAKQADYQEKMQAAAIRLANRVAKMDTDELIARSSKIKDLDQVARKALKLETERPAVLIDLKVLSQPVRPSREDDGRLRPRAPVELLEAD